MSGSQDLRDRLRRYALELPEAYEDHPWGETVVKVRGKIFLFLGVDEPGAAGTAGVKLDASHDQAMAAPKVAPMGYGMGKAGWVTLPLGGDLPVEVLLDWVAESYRRVAPKRCVAALDDLAAGGGEPPAR